MRPSRVERIAKDGVAIVQGLSLDEGMLVVFVRRMQYGRAVVMR